MSDLDFLFGGKSLDDAVATTWAEPASGLAEAFGLKDAVRQVGGRDAFACTGAQAWLVLQGSVDVFGVYTDPDSQSTVRCFMHSVDAGGFLLGYASLPDNLEIFAVPAANTAIVPVPRERLLQTIADEVSAVESVDALAGSRAGALAHAVASQFHNLENAVPYSGHTVVKPGPLELSAGELLMAGRGLIWLRCQPTKLVLGNTLEYQADGAVALPLCRGLWCMPTEDTTAQAIDTLEWVKSGRLAQDVDAALWVAARRSLNRCKAMRADNVQQLEGHDSFTQGRFRASLLSLIEILQGNSKKAVSPDRGDLGCAFERVMQHQGSTFNLEPAREADLEKSAIPLDAMVAAAGIQMRRVALKGNWWKVDHGPLVAFRHGKIPVALLPSPGKGYSVYTGQDPVGTRVTATMAEEFGDEAWFLFPPFPRGALSARRVLSFGLRGQSGDIGRIIVVIILSGLLSLVTPLITGWVIDPVIPDAMVSQLYVLTVALILAGMAVAAFALIQGLSMLRVEGAADYRVQAAVWDRLLNLEAGFFRGYSVGDLSNRANSITAMRHLLTGSVATAMIHGVMGMFSLGLMTYYDWRLAAVSFLVAVVYVIVVYFIGRRILSRYRETLEITGRLQAVVLQILSGLAKIRVADAEKSAFGRWSHHYASLIRISFQQRGLNNALIVFKSVFQPISVAIVLIVLGLQGGVLFSIFHIPTTWTEIDTLPLASVMPTADFVAFNIAFGQFMGAMFGISTTMVQLLNVKPLFERVKPILDAPLEHTENATDPGKIVGHVELRDVQFGYTEDAPPILKGLSIEAQRGEFIALVGPSGAGKSTIVRLLLGFDTPWSGSVFVDGKDVSQIDRRAMRRQYGVVLQNGRVLAGSIFHNIAAGSNVTRDEVWEAAKMAGLSDDIDAMPMGLDTFLNEGASTLSGGQRQRLMIARALVRNPSVVIFDEATSALDNRTQAIVGESLDRISCTRIVIAHRLSTIVEADRIYVLADGAIKEHGTYKELMKAGGLFAELARRQLA
jgi:NHLM bacteriocin system ABC transporter ATP-binding protein